MRNMVLWLPLVLCACNWQDKHDTTIEFDGTDFNNIAGYRSNDFSLSQDVTYWDIRLYYGDDEWSSEADETRVIFAYDDDSYSSLTEIEKALLEGDEALSDSGFSGQCAPGYCPVYIAGIADEELFLIVSDAELLSFFNDSIDTEAELHIWLWQEGLDALKYRSVAGGYEVLADYDNLCGTVTTLVLFVDFNGVMTVEEQLVTETYSGCV